MLSSVVRPIAYVGPLDGWLDLVRERLDEDPLDRRRLADLDELRRWVEPEDA